MENISANSKRIFKNTLLLYVRMGFSMIVGLYTSRLLLQALGIDDYGINNVVGGLVSLFSIVSGSLTTAISRFLTIELGSDNQERLKAVFTTSLIIQLALAIIVFIVCEIIGVWFLNSYLVIPAERMYAAHWVFHISLIIFSVNLLNIPYGSLIIAHEKMSIYAYIGLLNTFFTLITTILIFYSSYDKLIFYSILNLLVNLLNQIIYWVYCRKNFVESHLSISIIDKSLFKNIFSFASWNFIGAASYALKDQGGNILLNMFCGPAVNAARGIATAVNRYVGQFVNNFTIAVNPQITKSYANKDYQNMFSLMFRSARFSYYLFFIFALPLMLNINFILDLWLHEVPEHTSSFTILILIQSLLDTLSNPLVIAMLATGRIRNYQIVVGGIQFLNVPVSYIFLKLGYFPEIVMIVSLILSVMCIIMRMVMLSRIIPFNINSYLRNVVVNVSAVSIVSLIIPLLLTIYLQSNFINVIIIIFTSILISFLVILYIGCTYNERSFVLSKISIFKDKFIQKR